MEEMLDEVGRPWDQREGEADVWYRIFRDYYLPLGERRSIRNAFEFYIRVETPKQYEGLDPENITHVPGHWSTYARDYEWAKRALAYDEAKLPDFGEAYVTQVLTYLRQNAMRAASGLVAALNSDRTRVQAANSILNRIGVPESSEISLKHGVSFTSDDMTDAVRKVEEWKTKKLSGSPAESPSATS